MESGRFQHLARLQPAITVRGGRGRVIPNVQQSLALEDMTHGGKPEPLEQLSQSLFTNIEIVVMPEPGKPFHIKSRLARVYFPGVNA